MKASGWREPDGYQSIKEIYREEVRRRAQRASGSGRKKVGGGERGGEEKSGRAGERKRTRVGKQTEGAAELVEDLEHVVDDVELDV